MAIQNEIRGGNDKEAENLYTERPNDNPFEQDNDSPQKLFQEHPQVMDFAAGIVARAGSDYKAPQSRTGTKTTSHQGQRG